jgi:UDP-3-O-[3-hydroxymyristoyl] glucosamine N-acyltransferase
VTVGPWVVLGQRVRLGARVRLGPGVVIEDDVVLGDDCDLGPHVVVHRGVILGDRVQVKAGAVLGGSGFGFHSGPSGHRRVPHVGGVRIGDDVEIGANCTIDRGTLGDTVIGRGTKLDNLVHIGHNCRIGEHCIFAGGAMAAGSVQLGHFVIVGGGSGFVDHVRAGDGVKVAAFSMVTADLPAGATVSGTPAHTHRETLRVQAAGRRLPGLIRRLEALAEGSDRHA